MRRGPFDAACGFNSFFLSFSLYFFPVTLKTLIWPPEHFSKLTIFCTKFRSGEKLTFLYLSCLGHKKWLVSATCKFQNTLRLWRGGPSRLFRRAKPFGTQILQVMLNKKHYYDHAPWPTRRPPCWIESWKMLSQRFPWRRKKKNNSSGVLPNNLQIGVPLLEKWGNKSYPQIFDNFYGFRAVEPQSWRIISAILVYDKMLPFAQKQSDWVQI